MNKDNFVTRYQSVIEACARFVHEKCAKRGVKHVTTAQLARWVANDLPTLYRKTFGSTPKHLKVWRVKTMISNAVFLGAFESHDIAAVHGRGFRPVKKAKLRRVA